MPPKRVTPRVIELPREGGRVSRQVLVRDGGVAGAALPKRKAKAFNVISVETKPRKWGDVKIVRRPLNGWMIRIDDIDPVSVRQFSKKPHLEVKTDFPGMESFSLPVNVAPSPCR